MTVAALLGVLVPAAAEAAYTSPGLYDCVPRDPNIASSPPQPKFPPEVEARLAKAIESNQFEAVCPNGEVPDLTPIGGIPKRVAPSLEADGGASASRAWRGRRFAPVGGKPGRRSSGATASRKEMSG